jgi:hypothetical protein
MKIAENLPLLLELTNIGIHFSYVLVLSSFQ